MEGAQGKVRTQGWNEAPRCKAATSDPGFTVRFEYLLYGVGIADFFLLCPEGFDVAKTGDARIGFVGFPSVGKSTLLSNLAGVYSEVAAYEFTTLTTVPGVIRYKGAKIQVRDSSTLSMALQLSQRGPRLTLLWVTFV